MVSLNPVRCWETGVLFYEAFEFHSSFAGAMPRRLLNVSMNETRGRTMSYSQGRESKVRAGGLDIVVAQLPMVEGVVELEKRYYM